MKLIALYARVSKALEQNPENQLIELRRWCTSAGYTIEGEYVDEISSKDTRPEKEKVLRKLRLNQLDGVAFWALDRWGRSISELILELEEFSKSEKIMLSLKEGMDLSTAAGRLMANILACMANFERDRIHERTMLGLARARAQGKTLGRPKNLVSPKDAPIEVVKKYLSEGYNEREIAKVMETSKYRIEKAIKKIKGVSRGGLTDNALLSE